MSIVEFDDEVEYRTKTVVFKDSADGTKFTVMVTNFDGNGVEHLDDAGFGGEAVLFTIFSPHTMLTDHNQHRLVREHKILPGSIRPLLSAIKRGVRQDSAFGIGWDELQEGFVYTPQFVEGLT